MLLAEASGSRTHLRHRVPHAGFEDQAQHRPRLASSRDSNIRSRGALPGIELWRPNDRQLAAGGRSAGGLASAGLAGAGLAVLGVVHRRISGIADDPSVDPFWLAIR